MKGDDATRFRKHALECRRLAEETKDGPTGQSLIEIAEELESEADDIDGSENRRFNLH